ncbi:MAG: pseudouridine synthase [Pseudomonadota bacterium]
MPSITDTLTVMRALSKLGVCSRTEAEAAVRAGRVAVNGRRVENALQLVRLDRDRLTIDGNPVTAAAAPCYLMLNKPRGLVSTRRDERGRPTVYAALGQAADTPGLSPVGRLDQASEGLLLFSNDHAWAAGVTAPGSGLEKRYHVQIDGLGDEALLAALRAGRDCQGEWLQVASASLLRQGKRNCWLELGLTEGRNRHLRRLLAACGFEVRRLVRVAIGPLPLGDLPKGTWRPLEPWEVNALRKPIPPCSQP